MTHGNVFETLASTTGTLYFACQVSDHCQKGQKIQEKKKVEGEVNIKLEQLGNFFPKIPKAVRAATLQKCGDDVEEAANELFAVRAQAPQSPRPSSLSLDAVNRKWQS